MIPERDIQLVSDRSDLIDIVKGYVPELQTRGSKAVCCCPFHNERTASFTVDNVKGMWYCHGCHEGGNVFQFVEKIEGLSFPDAVRKVAELSNVHIEEKHIELTAGEKEARMRREAMLMINRSVCEFYAGMLWEDREEARDARDYIKSRDWSEDYAHEIKLGFAPKKGNPLLKYAESRNMNVALMIEMGLLKRADDDGRIYDAYRDRIIIPIRSQSNQVTGFTARLLHEDQYKAEREDGKRDFVPPKYINSQESECYRKRDSIFGIEKAVRMAVRDGGFYLVEGGPDVMRLHSIGVYNTVASLGGVWTEQQLQQLKKYDVKLCFIPDCDPPKPGETYGAGTVNVIKNGILAVNLGIAVTVKEIRQTDDGKKNDPDSFISSRRVLEGIDEEDFIIWYASKVFPTRKTLADKSQTIEEIAGLVAKLPNKTNASVIESTLAHKFGMRKEWKTAIASALKELKEETKRKRSKSIDRDTLSQYGFYEDSNCYYSVGAGGADCQWSNFIMTPLFHIEDSQNPKRLFLIKNQNGVEKIIELQQAQLTTVGKFSEKVEGLGNFIWLAKQEQLNKLKMYLYEQTETAVEIVQLGWQDKGFWAYGNGVFFGGEWIGTDDFGIVRLEGIGNYYLPAYSKIYKGETKLFQFERQFIHTDISTVTLREYTDRMIAVFGDNARVGICYLLATLFKDVVTAITKNFPILNLFGQKGSGKSEMGHSLMAFFITNNTPPNLQNATDAALADAVAQCANALVHLDEYKNTIDLNRREFLKGLYDGAGRTRMNMDRDKKREMTAVDCGVIVSGQEMPTIDNALFSRLIYLTFNTSVFSSEEKQKFNQLAEIRKMGCSHLTLEILRYRKKFEVEFPANYRSTLDDVVAELERDSIDDRILRGWVVPLAAFRTLEGVLDLQFDYRTMLRISREGIVRQNRECRSNNELSQFWNAVEVMHQQGLAVNQADFRICYESSLSAKINGKTARQEWLERRPVLYINFKVLLAAYQKYARTQGDTIVPEKTLRNYLEVSKEYLGLKTAVRFQMPNNQFEGIQKVETSQGARYERTSKIAQAYCFDYCVIADKYGINLEVEAPGAPDPKDIDTDNKELPYR